MLEPYNLLLADADGTLLDFTLAEDLALKAAMESLDLPMDEVRAARYKEINEALWHAFERKEVSQEALRTLRFARFFQELGVSISPEKAADAFVHALSQRPEALPGAEDFLREAAARVPVIIVTNGIPIVQRSRFGLSPLRRHIKGIVISGEVGVAKPDPRMIHAALALADLTDPRPLMLGDSLSSDIAAGENAGIASCWFNPFSKANQTAHRPTHEVRTLEEVLAWL